MESGTNCSPSEYTIEYEGSNESPDSDEEFFVDANDLDADDRRSVDSRDEFEDLVYENALHKSRESEKARKSSRVSS